MSAVGNIYRSIRSGVAPAAKSLLFRTGALSALRAVRPSDRLAILRYHAICGPEGHSYASPGICVSPAAFEQHVRYLAAHYTVMPLPDAVQALQGARSLPSNAVAITFDDGYADNLAAARLLARHGLTATFYITAGCLADGEPFWPAEIRILIAAIRDPLVRVSARGSTIEVPLGSPSERTAAVAKLTRMFKSHSIPERDAMRDQLRTAAGHPPMPRIMLKWEELGEMQRLGMTIGAHTVTHPNLPSAGLQDATKEIAGSKSRLEGKLGVPVTMFSYPNGGAERYYTPDLMRVVREAGFAAAATSSNGFAHAQSNLFALERVEVAERLDQLVFALEVERFAFQPA